MTDEELRQIEYRCRKATAGPWIAFVEGRDQFCGSSIIRTAGEDIDFCGATTEDIDFIANARQDIPKLLEEVCRLHSMLDE